MCIEAEFQGRIYQTQYTFYINRTKQKQELIEVNSENTTITTITKVYLVILRPLANNLPSAPITLSGFFLEINFFPAKNYVLRFKALQVHSKLLFFRRKGKRNNHTIWHTSYTYIHLYKKFVCMHRNFTFTWIWAQMEKNVKFFFDFNLRG